MSENENFEIVVKTLANFEPVLQKELADLGAENIQTLTRAVKCSGNTELLYRINYLARTALRVLKTIAKFKVRTSGALYLGVKNIEWENYFDVSKTIAINAQAFSEKFKHSGFVALKTKDAIADRFREKTSLRPSVDVKNADIRINVHIINDFCTVSLDSSGDSLVKRNYKAKAALAPLSEVLAAGIILLSEWDKQTDFVDFMCGSGTLVTEAGMIAKNIPPQFKRDRFAFKNWKDFDEKLWNEIKDQANSKILKDDDVKVKIYASDIEQVAVNLTRRNTRSIGTDKITEIIKSPFDKLRLSKEKKIFIINPPYGQRLQRQNTDLLYEKLGNHFKQNFPGSEAWIFSGNLDSLKRIGLKATKKIPLFNGALECKLQKYEMYSGSRKAKYQKNKN